MKTKVIIALAGSIGLVLALVLWPSLMVEGQPVPAPRVQDLRDAKISTDLTPGLALVQATNAGGARYWTNAVVSETGDVTNTYNTVIVTNLTVIQTNVFNVAKGGHLTISNSVTIQPVTNALLRTTSAGLITNAVMGDNMTFDGTTLASVSQGTDWNILIRQNVAKLGASWDPMGDTVSVTGTASAIAPAAGLPLLANAASTTTLYAQAIHMGGINLIGWNKSLNIKFWTKTEELTGNLWWIGWSSSGFGNAWATNDTPHTAGGVSFAGFRYSPQTASDTNWMVVTSNGAATTVANSGILANTNLHCFEFRLSADGSSVNFLIDNTTVASGVAATLPAANLNGLWGSAIANMVGGGGSARNLRSCRFVTIQKIL